MINRIALIIAAMTWLGNSQGAHARQTAVADGRYADHSVLASGQWVKIRVPETGLYQITDELAQQAGFADAAHVSVWGYGGALQPAMLTASYLQQTDDLQPVATHYADGRRLFFATGSVNWPTSTSQARTRNFYSDYGYYFLTEATDSQTELADSAEFARTYYPSPHYYHTLLEPEEYSWYHGGRQLFERLKLDLGVPRDYQVPAYSSSGNVTVNLTFKQRFQANVYLNGTLLGTVEPNSTVVNTGSGYLVDGYAVAAQMSWTLPTDNLLPNNTVTIEQLSGSTVRLDHIAITSNEPAPAPWLSDSQLPQPEIVGTVANQDRHADPQADMVIIIPSNRLLLEQAERLKQIHEEHDQLRVNVVVANELYNEFSSGTPDGNAYRRYMKMLYDRAETDDDRPRYLLLFGDGVWDNRMHLTRWPDNTTDDFLLCYESENSFSETHCFVTDDYYGYLDDNEGGNLAKSDLLDLGVGRFPVRTADEAKTMVDKIELYYANPDGGAWQNQLVFMGDDGNKNMHMEDCENVIAEIEDNYTGYQIQKIYWDAYQRQTSVRGDRYPDVERLIKEAMDNGALVMNYTGHGNPSSLSHESVLKTTDFEANQSQRLPLWVTASCDILPFDGYEKTLGETAVLVPNGGALAFFGTARTVYAYYNRYMNKRFMRNLLGTTNGRRNTIGDAVRLAKCELVNSGDDSTENKFQYVLLGDPAVAVAAPTLQASIETINGQPTDAQPLELKAGSHVTVAGSIPGHDDFSGRLAVTVYDAQQEITGLLNNKSEADEAIVFTDYPNIVYTGTHQVENGHFEFGFTVTRDLSYSTALAKMNVFAQSNDEALTAHGETRNFFFGSATTDEEDEDGPEMTCYIGSEDFADGDDIDQQETFYALLYDPAGINYSGNGIGHDLELVIDNKTNMTYNLNSLFQPNPDDGCRGTVEYQLPSLTYGEHRLRFKAWDMLNNSSTVTLRFNVVNRLDIQGIAEQASNAAPAQLYDVLGRKLSHRPTAGSGFYISRSANGEVRKIQSAKQ